VFLELACLRGVENHNGSVHTDLRYAVQTAAAAATDSMYRIQPAVSMHGSVLAACNMHKDMLPVPSGFRTFDSD